MFEIIKKKWRYFKCEIKTASRWKQVTVNKWVNAIEQNHLNDWIIQEKKNRHVAQRYETVLWLCLELFLL